MAAAGSHDEPSGLSVVVATYKRLARLAACLDGLQSQLLSPGEVIVVTHADPDSDRYVSARAEVWPQLRLIRAPRARSVASYNAGLEAATMPLVAYIDDDAVPQPDWIERIVRTFEQDDRIAAVGGCDVIVSHDAPGEGSRRGRRSPRVGHIQWFGRMTANHHLGSGPARDVDVLKGVNMSFRRSAVAGHGFDERLRGPGAVVHAELSICLPLRSRSLRVIYDPAIAVFHYPAPRPAGDHRASLTAESAFNAAHNEGLEILEYLDAQRRTVFAVWSLLVGNTEAPGIAVLARDLVRDKPGALIRFVAAQRGRAAAWRTRRLPRLPPSPAMGVEQPAQPVVSRAQVLSGRSTLDNNVDVCGGATAACIGRSNTAGGHPAERRRG